MLVKVVVVPIVVDVVEVVWIVLVKSGEVQCIQYRQLLRGAGEYRSWTRHRNGRDFSIGRCSRSGSRNRIDDSCSHCCQCGYNTGACAIDCKVVSSEIPKIARYESTYQ